MPNDPVGDDVQWPPRTWLVLPQGRNPLSLTAQNDEIKEVLHDTIKRVEYHLAFIHAFPELKMKTQFIRQQVYACAKARGYRDIADRVARDVWYVAWLASVVSSLRARTTMQLWPEHCVVSRINVLPISAVLSDRL